MALLSKGLRVWKGSLGLRPAGTATSSLGRQGTSQQVHASARRAATKDDALSSGKAPSSVPPDDPPDFDRFADLTLGGLWSKLDEGLRRQSPGIDCNVELEGGDLKVNMGDGGHIRVRRDGQRHMLMVESNLRDREGDFYAYAAIGTTGSEGDTDSMARFRLEGDSFQTEGGRESLHSYIESELARHLRVQVDLEPEVDKTYGPDPT